jgi:hypothetical protein
MCFHAAKRVDTKKNFLGSYKGPYGKGSREYGVDQLGFLVLAPICSVVAKIKIFKEDLPLWYLRKDLPGLAGDTNKVNIPGFSGDHKLSLYAAIKGRSYYMDEVMSASRIGVEGSMMTRKRKYYTTADYIKSWESIVNVFNEIDQYYEYKYHNEFSKQIEYVEYCRLIKENKLNKLKLLSIYKTTSMRQRFFLHFRYYMPRTYKVFDAVYRKFFR